MSVPLIFLFVVVVVVYFVYFVEFTLPLVIFDFNYMLLEAAKGKHKTSNIFFVCCPKINVAPSPSPFNEKKNQPNGKKKYLFSLKSRFAVSANMSGNAI